MKYPVPASFKRYHAIEQLKMFEANKFPEHWENNPLTAAFDFSETELGFDWWDDVLEQRIPPDEAIEILKEWIMDCSNMKYEIKQSVGPQGIADLFITALEGGSNYWLESFRAPQDVKEASTWAAFTNMRIEWTDAEDEGADGVRVIDKSDIQRGLAGMMSGYGVKYDSSDLSIDHDANSADIFLQYVLLGELVYG